MKTIQILILTAATIFSLHGQARPGQRDHRESPYETIERLQNKIMAYKEQEMKYSFCVQGLAKKTIELGSKNFLAGAAFARGSYREFDLEIATAKSISSDITNRCSVIPEFTEGL